MLARIVSLCLFVPLGILLIALAVSNRHDVKLVLDPFRPDAPAFAIQLPFYVYLWFAVLLGVLAGGLAVWLGQGRWRRVARSRSDDAQHWQSEANRLTRERDERVTRSKELVSANR